jgi:hypothetical protein
VNDAPRSLLVRRLCAAVVALAAAEFLIATVVVQWRHLPPSTDFATYYLAGAQARDGQSPYDRAALATRGRALGFTYDQFPFLYPPPFALAMQPLARLSYTRARQVWLAVATAAFLAALAMTLRLVRAQARRAGLRNADVVWIVSAALVPTALNSTSVHNDIRAGSVGSILFLCAATVAWAALPNARGGGARRDAALAAALAGAALVKLVPVVWIPWAAWRGRRRAAAWACVALVIALVPAVVHWGADIVPTWVHALVPGMRDDVSLPMNQSLAAAVSRFFVPSRWVEPPFTAPRVALVVSWLLSAAIVGGTLRALVRPRPDPQLVPVEFGYVVLAMLLVMKLTWVQTLCTMLFVWPALMIVLVAAAERDLPWARRAGLVACLGYFLSSAHFPILWASLRHGPAVALTTVHTLGLLLLWGVCGAVLRRAAGLQGCAATTMRGSAPAGMRL